MQTSISLDQEQIEYCKKIAPDVSKGVREAVDFHNEFYPLIQSLRVAKNTLDQGILNLGEYTAVVTRATSDHFDKIHTKKAGK